MPGKLSLHSGLEETLPGGSAPCRTARDIDRWGFGLAALFYDMPLAARDMPQRVAAYVQAFRDLRPHRACSVPDTPFQAMLQEPLFFNPRIRGPECGAPL